MNSWKDVRGAVEAATNSTGSAEKENSKYLNSIEGKTKAVESAMQKLASATVDDNLIKWFLDVEKSLISLQTDLGGLTPLILTIITLMSSKLVPALGMVIKTVKESFAVFSKTKEVSEDVSRNIAINTQLLNTAKISATGFFTAISAGITVISLIVGVVSSLIQKHKEYNESLIASARASSENFKKISELYTQYKNLSNIQERTAEQESELVTIGNSLEESLSSRSATLSKLKEGTQEYNAELLEQIKNESAISLASARTGLGAAKENFASGDYAVAESFLNQGIGSLFTNDGYKEAIKTVKEELKDFWNIWSGKYDAGSLENTPKFLNATKSALESLTIEAENAREAGNDELAIQIESTDLYKQLTSVVSDLTPQVQTYAEQLVAVQIAQAAFNGTLPTSEAELDTFKQNIFATIDPSNQFNDVLGNVVDTFFLFGQVVDDSNKYISQTKNWEESIASLTGEIGNMDNAQESLSKAVSEFNTNGSLSYDTVKTLLDLGSDYLQYLSVENGQLILNKEGIIALTEAKKAELLQDLEMARSSEILDARENEKEQLEILRNEHLSGWEQRQREIEITAETNEEILQITESYNSEIEMVSLLGTTLSDTTDEVERATEAYAEQSDLLDDAQSAYETLSSAIDEYNKNGVLSVDTLQSLLSLSPEYLQMFFDQAGALGDAEAATMAHVEALKQAKINELAAAAAAQILAVSQEAAGGAGSGATSGLSSFGSAAINMGNNAVASAGNVKVLQGAVYDLQQQLGTSVSVNWANAQVKGIVSNFNKLAGEIGGLGASFTSSGKKSSGGGSGSSKASQQAEAIADANEKLLDTTMKMIKAQKEDQIDALEDELDLEEELYEAEKKRLEDQIDKYKDVIDAKQKSLKLDKEQSEYDDEIANKNKEISDIQNRLTELEFDTSATAIAEKLKLQEDLTEKQKDLSESQADREYDLTNQALDDDYEAYKTSQEAQIELLNQNFEATKTDFEDRIQLLKDYLEEEGTIRTDALNMMGTKSAEFYNNLFAWNAKYGDVTNATLQSIIDKAYEVVAVSSGSSKSGTKKTTTVSKTVGTSVDWKALKTHHEGIDSGFVGSGLKGNEEFIKALKGEVYATPKQQDDYMEKYLPNMLKNAYVNGATNISAGTTMQYDKLLEINVSGSIDSDSVSKIQSTVNQAFGQLTSALAQRGTVRKANVFAI